MKKLILFLAAALQMPAAVSLSNVSVDHLSHSTGLVHFTASGSTVDYFDGRSHFNVYWNWLKVCYSATPGSCESGGGTIMPTQYPNDQSAQRRTNQNFPVIVSGLPSSTTLEVCPMVSQDNNTWATSCTTVTTLGKPVIHPVPAELPRNVTVPTVPTDYSTFHTTHSNGDGLIVGTTYPTTTCANLQSDMNFAQWNQGAYPTLIALAPGQASKCADRFYFGQNPPDVGSFNQGAVNQGAKTLAIGGFTEGQGIQFSHSYSNLPGEFESDPNDCAGIKPGQVYYAHFTNYGVDPNHLQLTCEHPYPKGRVMRLTDSGGGSNMFYAHYPRQIFPIVLRTATPDSLLPPPGTRMSPAWSSKLAVIQPESRCAGINCDYAPPGGSSIGFRKTAALAFGDLFDDSDYRMAANIYVIGLEIQSIDASGDSSYDPLPTWNLVTFKQGTSDNTLDRCYIHGQEPFPNRLAWGITWDGHANAITNSYFDRIVYPFRGPAQSDTDTCGSICDSRWQTEGTQFIQAATGPGPYIFSNNFLQTTGNGWHFNGAGDGGFTNTYSQDIYIRRSTMTQNPENNKQGYCNGNTGSTLTGSFTTRNRQPFEIKGGWRAHLDGNIFEYDCHWLASSAVALTSVTGGIFDVTFTNNTWRHVSGAAMGGSSTQGGQDSLNTTSRYTYKNNLFWDIDGCKYMDHQSSAYNSDHGFCWNGYAIQTIQDGEDFIWDHNTIAGLTGFVPSMFYLASGGVDGLKITNSILYAHGLAGTAGTGNGARVDGGQNQDQATSCNGFTAEALLKCSWKFPGSIVSGNLVISDTLTKNQINDGAGGGSWPTQKTTATPSDLSLVNWQSLANNDYHLKTRLADGSTNPYASGGASHASDGKAVGADIDALERAQGKVTFTSVVPASTTATVNFVAPDAQGCPVDVSTSDSTLVNTFTRTADAGGSAGPRSVSVSGLSAHSDYYFRIDCAVEQPKGTFHTN